MKPTPVILHLSLRWQILLIATLPPAIGLIALGFLSFDKSRAPATDLTVDKLIAETKAINGEIENDLKNARGVVLQIPKFPSIRGIIRTWDSNGQDPQQRGSPTRVWIEGWRSSWPAR